MTFPEGLADLLRSEDERVLFPPLLEAIRRRWPENFGVRVELLYFNQEQQYLEQIEQVGFDKTREAMQVRQVTSGSLGEGLGICAYSAATRESVLVQEVAFDRRYSPVQEEGSDRTQSELAVPLLVGRRLLGVLNVEAERPHAFGNEDLRYCEELSSLLALLIDYETYQLEEAFLRETERTITLIGDHDSVLKEILERVLALTGHDCLGCVLVPVERSNRIENLKVVANHGLNLTPGEERGVNTFGVIKEALASPLREKYWRRNVNGVVSFVELAPNIKSEFAVVLEVEDQVIAIINLESSRPNISERYRRAIRQMANHVGVMLHSIQIKGDLDRRQGAETILDAADMEAHTLGNLIGRLMPALTKLESQLPHTKMQLAQGLLQRIKHLERTLKSFLNIGPVSLREVLMTAKEQAMAIDMELNCQGDVDLLVFGSKSGFVCIFENLLLNTSKHGKHGKPAYLSVTSNIDKGVLRYWNEVDESFFNNFYPETFMGGHQGQGLKIIDVLSRRYDWSVYPERRGCNLEFVFEFKIIRK